MQNSERATQRSTKTENQSGNPESEAADTFQPGDLSRATTPAVENQAGQSIRFKGNTLVPFAQVWQLKLPWTKGGLI